MRVYRQGDTIRFGVKLAQKGTGDPTNLTGCTAFSQMRKYPEGELIAEGTPYINVPLGIVGIEYTKDQTAQLEPGEYGYDIRMKSEWGVNRQFPDAYIPDDPGRRAGTDVITLYSTRIKIIPPYTVLEA